jgi:ABC-type transport system substrate-binding protein
MGLLFNGARGPFVDKRVRQAVAFAIRRDEIVKAAFLGRGAPLQGIPIDPGSEFFNEEKSKHWTYNPERAKQLLAEAGVPGGFSCTLLSTAQYGMHKTTAEVVQQHLGEIGIQVQLNLPDWATRVALGNRGQYEFGVVGTTAEMPDPDGLAPIMDSTLPIANSRSYGIDAQKLHELFVAGRSEFDPVKRKEIYDRLQDEAFDVVTLAGLAWRSQGYAMKKDVEGFTNLPGAMTFNSGQTLESTFVASA